MHSFTYSGAFWVIIPCSLIAILYALFNYYRVSQCQISKTSQQRDLTYLPAQEESILFIGKHISEGAQAFLHAEYQYLLIFLGIFALVILIAVDIVADEETSFQLYTTLAFLLGGLTSMLAGYLGMMVATFSNTKVAHLARQSLDDAFKLAYRAGCVVGFGLTGLSLLMLAILIGIYLNLGIAP